MNKTYLMILAAIALPAFAFANPETEQALTKMEQDFSAALVKGDTATLAPMMADDLYIVTPDGGPMTKASFLSALKSGGLKFESNQLSDIKVQAADADMAVITYRSTDKGTASGKDISGEYRWTDVVAKRNGNWQFIVAQGTPVQSGGH